MKIKHMIGLIFVLPILGCQEQSTASNVIATASPEPIVQADAIYFGGDILTMVGEKPNYAQAIAVKNDKIIYVGSKQKAYNHQFANTKLIDLKGKTLMPGFIDGHSHVYGVGLQAVVANVLPPPDGQAGTVEQLITLLQQAQQEPKYAPFIEKTGVIMGFGYDDAQLERYPNRYDLDKVSQDKPVIIVHTSGHLSVANSKALQLANITKTTQDPQGGVIRREPDTGEPNGVLEENAHFALLFQLQERFDNSLQDLMLREGQGLYAQFGYTTAQEGRATGTGYETLVRAAENNNLILDVVAYPDMVSSSQYMASTYNGLAYQNQFRIGGVKLNLDGSPQGKTAWLSHPYHVPPEGQSKDYAGYATFKNEQAYQYVETAFANNWQVLTHANGDAAIEQFLTAVEQANNKLGKKDRRPVLIHGQTIREDQVKRLKPLGIFPSLFPMHTFYWGDWHADSVLGHPRADYISPTKAVLNEGLMFTSHHDAPVALPSSVRVLDATVNRTTRTNKVLGPEQRVTTYEALSSLTKWAAYQYFEENNKGQLQAGMQADFVILDKNPIKIPTEELKNLVVVETISRGKTIYAKQ